MGFRFRRSVKLLPGIRLNFGKRGISTSIGVRGAHVTFGSSGTRTTVGLPGSGLSYTHLDRSHRSVSRTLVADPTAGASSGSPVRGFLWIGLIGAILVSAIARMMTPPQPQQFPTPTRTTAEVAAQAADQSAHERSAQVQTAALGLTQIRHAVANSNTLRLSRVTLTSNGTICYEFHLRNSRGVAYVRTALIEGTALKISGSEGFTALWNNRCADKVDANITTEVQAVLRP